MSPIDDWLRARIRSQLAAASESGDLQPTPTEAHRLEEGGLRFSVRVVAGPDRKKRSRRDRGRAEADPFQPPYTDDLFVAELSSSHVALLNKFPVLDDHLLIVTREDLPQQGWLSLADFQALQICRQQLGGFAFYNGGRTAGASQPHRHLQLVPMPVTTEALLDDPDRGFACAQAEIPVQGSAESTFALYRALLSELGIDADRDPYNLLLTGSRMVVVPRTRHDVEGIFLNAMGYAGSFLVRDREKLERLRSLGPRAVLARAGRPA